MPIEFSEPSAHQLTPQRQREKKLLIESNANLELLRVITESIHSLPFEELQLDKVSGRSNEAKPSTSTAERTIDINGQEWIINAQSRLRMQGALPSLEVRISLESPQPTEYKDYELGRVFTHEQEVVAIKLSFDLYEHLQEIDIQSRIDVRDTMQGQGLGGAFLPLTHEVIRQIISAYPAYFEGKKVISTVTDLSQRNWTSRNIEKMGYKRSLRNRIKMMLTRGYDDEGNKSGPTYTYRYQ
jgi:hypothetical protein